MNRLDVSCMGETIHKVIDNPKISEVIYNRICHSISILDNAYGERREAFAMGGFVFLLTDIRNAKYMRREILDCYALSEENSEYTEEICREKDNTIWQEELYLRSSDDAIVIIYVKKRGD